jgi:outer membrane receptor for ferrienterochelin and colicin
MIRFSTGDTLSIRAWVLIQTLSVVMLLPVGQAFARSGITGILEGRARDKQTREYLPLVNVMIVALGVGTATNDTGYYRISNLRAGDYDVRFSIVGYKNVIVRKVAILPDLRTRLDIDLESTSIQFPTVEITAKHPLIQVDQAATAFQIEQTKLDRLPLTKFQDIVGLQPGTTIEGNIRGSKITDAVYLVDGLPIQDVIKGGIGTSIPKSSIGSVTVTTGGRDAEYGNALSGIINVVTRSGENTHKIAARLEGDQPEPQSLYKQTDKSYEGELTASGPLVSDKLYYFTADLASLSGTRWWQDFEHFFKEPIKREFSGISKLDYFLSPTSRLGLQAMYSFQQWHDYEYSWRYDLSGLPKEIRNSYRLALTLSNTIGDKGYYTVSLSTFSNHTRINDSPKNGLSLLPYEYDFYLQYILSGSRSWWENTLQDIYTLKADLTLQSSASHLLKAGFTLDQYSVSSDLVKYEPQLTYFGKPILDAPMLNYSNAYSYQPRSGSVYVQDKIKSVTDEGNVTLGLRWDFFDPTAERPIVEFIPVTPTDFTQVIGGKVRTTLKQQVSPRVSVGVPLDPATFAFLNFGFYFQFPLFDYLYSGLNPAQLKLGTKNVQAGNTDLEPERLVMWEVGVKQILPGDLVASATYFNKTINNEIDTKTLIPFDSRAGGDYGFISYVNNATANAYGFELIVSRERNEILSGSVSYTYMVTEGTSEYTNQNLNIAQWGFKLAPVSYPLSWDQRHTVKADLDFKLPGRFQCNVVVFYNSPRPYTYYPTADGFTPLDTTKMFVPNNRRMSDYFCVDCKISASFNLGLSNTNVFLYADIRNLFNKLNVKWMDSMGRIGGELGDPSAYYDPRRVKIGLRMEL